MTEDKPMPTVDMSALFNGVGLGHKILDADHNVVDSTLLEWAKFTRESEKKIVAQDRLKGFFISTVFLGIDHGFGGKPLWFETMIFHESYSDLYCDRYETWDEAVAGHKKAIKLVRLGKIKAHKKKIKAPAKKTKRK